MNSFKRKLFASFELVVMTNFKSTSDNFDVVSWKHIEIENKNSGRLITFKLVSKIKNFKFEGNELALMKMSILEREFRIELKRISRMIQSRNWNWRPVLT